MAFERPLTGRRGADRVRLDLVLTLAGDLEIAVSRDAPDIGREDPAKAVSDVYRLTERRLEQLVNGASRAGRCPASEAAVWQTS